MYKHHDAHNHLPLAANKLNDVLNAYAQYKNDLANHPNDQVNEEIATAWLVKSLGDVLDRAYLYEE